MVFNPKKGATIASVILWLCCMIPFILSAQVKQKQQDYIFTDTWKQAFIEKAQSNQLKKIKQGRLKIVAVMVEFQPDSNRFTTGNGTFNPDYLDTTSVVIDPLPHNRAYFEAHLSFVKHYYETASRGKLQVEYSVLPTVYRLDEEMAYYAQTGTDNSEDYKLGNFLKDTWKKVDEDASVSIANWDSETCFLVFHAGAGRDFDFLSTTLDRTPQDLPSLYLNFSGLKTLIGDNSFSGFSVKGFTVTNTGILPETQSRTGTFLEEPYILQLAINGFVTAVVGNHIGMPDLFNTFTGSSGIGRFGLMDPEGFFAFFGLFPPLPSAWERLYMEWDTAEEINISTNGDISLEAVSQFPNSSVKKYSISPTEYYLIENRHRDAQASGITLTIQQPDGNRITKTYTPDSTKFTAENSDSLISVYPKGVLVSTSNYDYALPGGLDIGSDGKYFTGDDRYLNGGILIWHVDETVLQQGIPSNRVNANPSRKGIRLIEADGSQDIGKTINNIFLASVVGGTAFDFWWSGNNYTVITERGDSIRVYQNRFAPDTRPSTATNTGGYNPVEFYSFSGNNPIASFRVRAFEGLFSKDHRFESSTIDAEVVVSSQEYPQSAFFFYTNGDSLLIIPSDNGVFAVSFDESKSRIPEKIANSSLRQPISYNSKLIITENDQTLKSLTYDGNLWSTDWTSTLNEPLTAGVSITLGMIDIEMSSYVINPLNGQVSFVAQKNDITSASSNGFQALLQANTISHTEGNINLPSGTVLSDGIHLGIIQFSNLAYYFLRSHETTWYINARTNEMLQTETSPYWPTYRVNAEQTELEIISTTQEGNLSGMYMNGTTANHFPFSIKGKTVELAPISYNLDSEDQEELLVLAKDSLRYSVYGFSSNNELLDGFPLDAGPVMSGKYPLQPIIVGNRLWLIHSDGQINAWIMPQSSSNSSLTMPNTVGKWTYLSNSTIKEPELNELLIKSETYNWPNPAKDETHIRFQTQTPASIVIDIYSMSGKKVWSTTTQTRSTTPTEINLNTSNWGNGLYYVRVQAKSSEKTDTKIIKLLVEH